MTQKRVLVVSNYYPPYFYGGYEIGCKAVNDALSKRGYDIQVLTSSYGVSHPTSDGVVHRYLETDSDIRGGYLEKTRQILLGFFYLL